MGDAVGDLGVVDDALVVVGDFAAEATDFAQLGLLELQVAHRVLVGHQAGIADRTLDQVGHRLVLL